MKIETLTTLCREVADKTHCSVFIDIKVVAYSTGNNGYEVSITKIPNGTSSANLKSYNSLAAAVTSLYSTLAEITKGESIDE